MRYLDYQPTDLTWVLVHRHICKRVVDVVISGAALMVLSPLMLLLMIMVRLDSAGPALFRQQRVGKDGKLFTCLKFRTMYHNNDDSIHRNAWRRFAAGQAVSDDPEARFKLARDPRITRAGAFLRRTSLDELPQLINVLRGDMAIVGPRPAIPYELEHYKPWQHQRYAVKPGITGMWQVYGRSRVAFDEMMALDVSYVNNWTVGLDLKLIFLTVPAVLLQRGAR